MWIIRRYYIAYAGIVVRDRRPMPDIKPCLRLPTCPAVIAAITDGYESRPCTDEDWRKCPLTEGGNKVEAK